MRTLVCSILLFGLGWVCFGILHTSLVEFLRAIQLVQSGLFLSLRKRFRSVMIILLLIGVLVSANHGQQLPQPKAGAGRLAAK